IAAQRMAALGTPAAISPEAAAGTPGAILVRAPSGPRLSGHVAVVVTPAGGTVEAYDTAHGVIASSALRRRWDLGVLVPRLEVTLGWVDLEVPSIVLRVGNRGPGVLRAQRALAERGHDPGPLDSIYGPKTAAAVVAFQRAAHLVPDGELGPITAAQLDLTL
ncbi:MAG: peptidoglycan-binding protein, partial [Myxococcales bacterium]|nr:peptidoglycan-binding protein [Myxococcales bacterium]